VGGIPKGLASGEFVIEPLIETTMVVVVRKGSALQKVKSLKNLADAKWVYTGNTKDEGYAKTLYEMHGLPAPHVGALVNSTLALLSLVSAGEFVGLMPAQIAQSPIASQFISIVPVKEKALPLTVGAIVRSDMVVSPAVKHFINHLHRSAHQVLKMGL
jgi:DNA-binding transcriptional LysR family regulator